MMAKQNIEGSQPLMEVYGIWLEAFPPYPLAGDAANKKLPSAPVAGERAGGEGHVDSALRPNSGQAIKKLEAILQKNGRRA